MRFSDDSHLAHYVYMNDTDMYMSDDDVYMSDTDEIGDKYKVTCYSNNKTETHETPVYSGQSVVEQQESLSGGGSATELAPL